MIAAKHWKGYCAAFFLILTMAGGVIWASRAYADPTTTVTVTAPPPQRPDIQNAPCGLSIDPVPIPHLLMKQCPPPPPGS
jgi:hypothetical protein